ncbi:MAG: hypothetical protein AVDCRST_MAG12-229 [uncultured Rubrobacteraceae bacterium]|uniref:Uncharacterized protein n=1 Tax=uncultured Rubrobacteraceae bacterium TaxID=349277 RepID=A0A6J4R627_9ACTN|nr:MAG: hypothetical protein AVDCRST_MAG12-229 [uncultured Rubrobacteraceae bacterium]
MQLCEQRTLELRRVRDSHLPASREHERVGPTGEPQPLRAQRPRAELGVVGGEHAGVRTTLRARAEIAEPPPSERNNERVRAQAGER